MNPLVSGIYVMCIFDTMSFNLSSGKSNFFINEVVSNNESGSDDVVFDDVDELAVESVVDVF